MNRGILLLFVLAGLSSWGSTTSCPSAVASFFPTSKQAGLRFPKGFSTPGQELQYGFEAEYTLTESKALLGVYGPDPQRFATIDWDQWSPEQRHSWMMDHLDELFPTLRNEGYLVKRSTDPKWEFLPNRLIRDSTGNLEIVLKPEQEWERYVQQLQRLNEEFGEGSMQATVSVTKQMFYARDPAQWMGVLNWMQEKDTLEKLKVGLGRWRKDPTKAVALSFQHPFLGPMTAQKQKRLWTAIQENHANPSFTRSHMSWVSSDDSSFKYVGGTAYRPDLVDDRVILEIRDCHTNWNCLQSRLQRLLELFENEVERQLWVSFKAFDSESDFEALPMDLREFLKTLFPARLKSGEEYSAAERLALEVYRNFAYPLRDWSLWPGQDAARLESAQKNYLRKLEGIRTELSNALISADEASRKVQGALVEFIDEAGLAALELGRAIVREEQRQFAA
jgi:hypothetical protein